MMLNLAGPIIRPKTGAPQSALVLLHGYGSDGHDLIGLAPLFADLLPAPLIFSPNAPAPCALNPSGYQWFPLGTSGDFLRLEGIEDAALTIHVLLESLWAETGLGAAQTYLAGFSQGGMLALFAGLSCREALAGIVSFSGGLPFDADAWPEIAATPPVLIVHGDADEVVPAMMSVSTADALNRRGFDVTYHASPNGPHGISPDGVEAARAFFVAHRMAA